MSPAFRATVVLPVRDGAAHLPALLVALARQDLGGRLEVVAVDSGSRDGSVAILEGHGARVLRIAPREFDHGLTRNAGAREARGGALVFLTQDAVPADERCVRRLVETLEADRRLAGAFARQVPRADADPLTRRDLAGWVAAAAQPRTVVLDDPAAFAALPAVERYRLSVFDNVASAVRRDVLLAHPFPASRFGEDLEWGLGMLGAGFGLAYVPDAVVLHSHRRSARALYRRSYLDHRLLLRLFGLRTIPDRAHLLRALLGAVTRDLGVLLKEGASPRAWLPASGQAFAAVYGQYRGARDEALARPYPEWA